VQLNNVFTIFRKEITDFLRDRRTIISLVIAPLLVTPVMSLGSIYLMSRSQQAARVKKFLVAVNPEAGAAGVTATLEKAGFEVTALAEVRSAVENKRAELGIELSGAAMKLYTDASQLETQVARGRVQQALDGLKQDRIKAELRKAGIPDSILTPFTIQSVNVAPPRRMSGNIFGGMLGLMLVIFLLTGGMYPAMDMTVGEKERRTLEMLLSSAAGRGEIVLGKLLAVIAAVISTAVLAVGSMGTTLYIGRNAAGPNSPFAAVSAFPLDTPTLLLILLSTLPMAVLSAAVMLAVSVKARSQKEATSYLTPMMFVGIFLAMFTMMPGSSIKTQSIMLVPIANFCKIVKDLLLGDWSWQAFGITLAVNIALAGVAVLAAVRNFNDEKVLFRT
jgi:sodium transport system permease protein